MITSVRAGRWGAGPHEDRTGILGTPKRIYPSGRKTRRTRVVDRIIEILRAIAGRFDDDDASTGRVSDCREIIGPPLDGDISTLIRPVGKIEARARPVQFKQDDVAGAEEIGSIANRRRRAESAEDGNGARIRIRTDAGNAGRSAITAKFADHGRAMIAPDDVIRLRAADDTALILRQVLVGKTPLAFDIDDAHAGAAASGPRPRVTGVDAAGRSIEIELSRREIRCNRRCVAGNGQHVVEERGRFRRRLDESSLDLRLRGQFGGELVQPIVVCPDAIIERHFPSRGARRARGGAHHTLFGGTEERDHCRALSGQQVSEVGDIVACGRRHRETSGAQASFGSRDDDQLPLDGERRGLVRLGFSPRRADSRCAFSSFHGIFLS